MSDQHPTRSMRIPLTGSTGSAWMSDGPGTGEVSPVSTVSVSSEADMWGAETPFHLPGESWFDRTRMMFEVRMIIDLKMHSST